MNDVVADPVLIRGVNSRRHVIVLEAARELGTRVVYGSTVWVYGDGRPGETHDEDAAASAPEAPLHGDEARRRDVLPLLRRALRRRADDPPLRNPLRPARPRRDRARRVHREGPCRRAADARGRRQHRRASSSTSRISPTASSPASLPPRAGRIYNLVGEESTTIREIAETVRELVAPVADRLRRGPRGRHPRSGEISGARAATSSAGGRRRASPKARAATSTGSRPRREHRSLRTASSIDGRAATVSRQEPGAL